MLSRALLARKAAPAMNKRPPMAPMMNPISPIRLAVSGRQPDEPHGGRVALQIIDDGDWSGRSHSPQGAPACGHPAEASPSRRHADPKNQAKQHVGRLRAAWQPTNSQTRPAGMCQPISVHL